MHTFVPRSFLEALGIRADHEVEFERPNGTLFTRVRGAAILHVAGCSTIEDVVAGEEGDEPVLGWRALSGLNLRIDERTNRLVDNGPIPAAPLSAGSSFHACR
jgi:predicted aspartyl protease